MIRCLVSPVSGGLTEYSHITHELLALTPECISASPSSDSKTNVNKLVKDDAVSIPPTDPNTISKPMNILSEPLITLLLLSSQHVSSQIFPVFIGRTNLRNSDQGTKGNFFAIFLNLSNKSKGIGLD